VARVVLAVGAATWLLAAVAAAGIGLIGVDRLAALLPPLAIDRAALGGALLAVAAALALAGLAHLAILLGLRRGHRRALSAAILLCGCCSAVFVALVAAAFASAAAEPSMAIPLLAAGAAAALAAVAYLLATARFIGELAARARV
jgi:hypothetical protein